MKTLLDEAQSMMSMLQDWSWSQVQLARQVTSQSQLKLNEDAETDNDYRKVECEDPA